ncbi:hypothetical protein GCM10009677_13650 [Sphaerisporangium rubeum]
MDDLGAYLLGEDRDSGLFPDQAGAAAGYGRGAREHLGLRGQPGVAFGVGPLAHDGEVGSGLSECRYETVDVSDQPAAIGRDRCGVNENSRHQERSPLPLSLLL